MAVVDYTSSLVMGPDVDLNSVNDKYCVLGANDIVTVSFSCTLTKDLNAIAAKLPSVLVANVSNIFFTAFKQSPGKGVAGGRIDSSGNIIINNSAVGNNYWIAVTYVRRT